MAHSELTLMAVHAHPDDEASSTGGILAHYGDQGIKTVLVTCTNGELGDGPAGVKPGEKGHDEAEVVATRMAELEKSCEILNVSALELLGYHDSGMMGWPQNDAPGSFWSLDVEKAAQPLIALIEKYEPQVLVTYDQNGFYGHPDHIQAHRITMFAADATKIAKKIYFPSVPKSRIGALGEVFDEAGLEQPFDPEETDFGTPDELVGALIDCSAVVNRKYDALEAHKSQTENAFFLQLNREQFAKIFAWESFLRYFDASGSPHDEDDLFLGLR